MSDQLIEDRLRIVSKMLYLGERIKFGSDAELMEEAASEIERLKGLIRLLSKGQEYIPLKVSLQ